LFIVYESKLSSDAFGGIRSSQEPEEHIELDGDKEDDEPVFVLTDEWREFFAKSQAKRKLGNSLHTYIYSLVMQFMCVLNCLIPTELAVEKFSMDWLI
jgi:hypothetical protein